MLRRYDAHWMHTEVQTHPKHDTHGLRLCFEKLGLMKNISQTLSMDESAYHSPSSLQTACTFEPTGSLPGMSWDKDKSFCMHSEMKVFDISDTAKVQELLLLTAKGNSRLELHSQTLVTTVVASMHAISCRTFCQSCSHGIDGTTSSIVQFILLVHSRIKSTVNQRPGSLLHHQSPKKSIAKGSVCWSCLRLSQHVTDTHLLRSEPWYRGVLLGFGQRWWVQISLQQHNIWCFCLFCCLQQVICQLYYLHHAPINWRISELPCENLGQASNRWWRL
jgi:hypothetical protein